MRQKHYGNYRGIVISNEDVAEQGRVKIYVPGIYPEKFKASPELLPYANPVSGMFGGGWSSGKPQPLDRINQEVGVCSVPHSNGIDDGAQVWVFFEAGDIQYPNYFGVAQSGPGWFADHPNQHVVKTDNVTIVVDEGLDDARSLAVADSPNKKCTPISIKKHQKQNRVRIEIKINAPKKTALDLHIIGDVNMTVLGDMYTHHVGDKHETHLGDLYKHHVGNIEEVHEGIKSLKRVGDTTETREGNRNLTSKGDVKETRSGNTNYQQNGNLESVTMGNKKCNVVGNRDVATCGKHSNKTEGPLTLNASTKVDIASKGNITVLSDGTYTRKGAIINDGAGLINLAAGTINLN